MNPLISDSNHCFKIEIDIPTSYKLIWISVGAFFLKKLLRKGKNFTCLKKIA